MSWPGWHSTTVDMRSCLNTRKASELNSTGENAVSCVRSGMGTDGTSRRARERRLTPRRADPPLHHPHLATYYVICTAAPRRHLPQGSKRPRAALVGPSSPALCRNPAADLPYSARRRVITSKLSFFHTPAVRRSLGSAQIRADQHPTFSGTPRPAVPLLADDDDNDDEPCPGRR